MAAGRPTVEDVSYRRVAKGLETKAVLQTVAGVLGVEVTSFGQRRRGSPLRAVAVRFLLRDSGLTRREIAALLGMGTGAAARPAMGGLRDEESAEVVVVASNEPE